MKKILSVILMSGALLAACSPEAPTENNVNDKEIKDVTIEEENKLVDGTYRVEEAEFGETGWKEALEILIVDGKISEATWESVDEDGLNKFDDDNYQEIMTAQDGLGPQDFIPALEEALVKEQEPGNVDVITGATGTAEKFKKYSQLLIDASLEGKTEVIIIDSDFAEEAIEDTDDEDTEVSSDNIKNIEKNKEGEDVPGDFSGVGREK